MPLPQTEIPARLQALLAECGIPMTDQRGTVHFAPLMKSSSIEDSGTVVAFSSVSLVLRTSGHRPAMRCSDMTRKHLIFGFGAAICCAVLNLKATTGR
jgi:hypothetical protein